MGKFLGSSSMLPQLLGLKEDWLFHLGPFYYVHFTRCDLVRTLNTADNFNLQRHDAFRISSRMASWRRARREMINILQ